MSFRMAPRHVLALGMLMAWSGWAGGVDQATGEPLEQVQQHLKATRQTREALQSVRDRLDRDLAEIERRQGQISRTLFELEAELKARDQRLAAIRQQRDSLLGAVTRQQRRLAGQLRGAYVIGRKDWLKLLLNQEEPSRLARVLAYYGYLNEARATLIQRWRQDVTVLHDTEAELSGESARQAATRKRLQQERAALRDSTLARRQLLASWDVELHSQDARLAQLKEDEQRLKSLIQSVATADVPAPVESPAIRTPLETARKGRCPPPGKVLARFGDPRMSGRWDGMLIGGKEGVPVRAVAAGQVAFADWFRGYGLLMIVDHGDGVMSVYAFNQTLYKNKGDGVSADEVIGAVGVSGGREQPGLYFGIREQGQPVDPLTWCASRS